MSDDDLSALVFELQRARTSGEKARALARAWRTLRGLNSVDRRMLAREVGFDGAEDLIDGLAGKGGGVFSPAAVLEALSKMRRGEGLSVRGILSDLRDPDRRDDLLVRGMDLVADSFDGIEEGEDEPSPAEESARVVIPAPPPGPGAGARDARAGEIDDEDLLKVTEELDHESDDLVPPPPATEPEDVPVSDDRPFSDPEPPEVGTEPQPEPNVPTPWDSLGSTPLVAGIEARSVRPGRSVAELDQMIEKKTGDRSVRERLHAFRQTAEELHDAETRDIVAALDTLPEPWARRRAVVALIEADIPDDAARALDLIEELGRAMDRRWCLSTLARRGDLAGSDLERALGMVSSPAARRRVEALASRG